MPVRGVGGQLRTFPPVHPAVSLRENTGPPPKRLPGSVNQYGRYRPHPNLWKPAQPHEGRSGTREGEPLARADPDRPEVDSEP